MMMMMMMMTAQMFRTQTEHQQKFIQTVLESRGISTGVWLGGRRENLYANSFQWRWCSGTVYIL